MFCIAFGGMEAIRLSSPGYLASLARLDGGWVTLWIDHEGSGEMAWKRYFEFGCGGGVISV